MIGHIPQLCRTGAILLVAIFCLACQPSDKKQTPPEPKKTTPPTTNKVTPPPKPTPPPPQPLLNGGKPQSNLAIHVFFIADHRVEVEIADTDYTRQIGMMYRKSHPQDAGMLFVYPTKRKLSFWMKNTYIPLDIAFINEDGTIGEIRQMEPGYDQVRPPSTYSVGEYRFALEMNKNWFKNNKVKVGDYVDGIIQLHNQ